MANHKRQKRRRSRDSAEKRMRAFLAEHKDLDGKDLIGALDSAGINFSAERLVKIQVEMGLCRWQRKPPKHKKKKF
jgi:hypothetical protein